MWVTSPSLFTMALSFSFAYLLAPSAFRFSLPLQAQFDFVSRRFSLGFFPRPLRRPISFALRLRGAVSNKGNFHLEQAFSFHVKKELRLPFNADGELGN